MAAEADVIEIPGGGFVRLLDHMGDDLTVVNAARVSMHKHHDEFTEGDAGLVRFLGRHNHWTPFSHPQVQLHLKMPIAVARQWFKHMIGLTRNEVSRRYVREAPEFFEPPVWRQASRDIKQGSLPVGIEESAATAVTDAYRAFLASAGALYKTMLDHGVCAEQARFALPQAMFTEFHETGSLAAYARICSLRCKPDAQKETREYAAAIATILERLFPHSWAALRS